MTTMKTLLISLAALATAVIAAPATPTRPDVGTSPRDASESTCTDGVPATQLHPEFPIDGFTLVLPAVNLTSYAINKDWYNAHFVSGPHYIAAPTGSDPYGAFKCQYTCNAAERCSSFFVWHDQPGTSNDRSSCVLFDAVLPPSVFEPSTGTMVAGGYDRIC
ncbi:hypothetical protein V8F33_003164, partial [Rhypophila sp. PSN 637]